MVELFANRGDPDQTPRSAASDLGLQCMSDTRLGVSSLQKVNNALVSQSTLVISTSLISNNRLFGPC